MRSKWLLRLFIGDAICSDIFSVEIFILRLNGVERGTMRNDDNRKLDYNSRSL